MVDRVIAPIVALYQPHVYQYRLTAEDRKSLRRKRKHQRWLRSQRH